MAIEPGNARRWLQLGLLGAALCAPATAVGNGPASESAPELRARASRLFRAKKFAAACPLYEAASRLLPGEPELLADLALCQHRLGNDELALQTNLDAITRASEAGRLDDPRFARIRRHAYFNLSQFQSAPEAAPSSNSDPGCWELAAAPGCSKTLHACSASRTDGGRTYRSETSTVRLALTAEAASIEDSEQLDSGRDFEALSKPSAELPSTRDAAGSLDYVSSFSEEQLNYDCEWACESSGAVAEEVKKCQSSPKLAAAAHKDCERSVCERAERSPWAAVNDELKESDACFKHAASVDGEYSCDLVYANACTGLVALSCSGHAAGEHQTLTSVEEYRFQASAEMAAR